jgi:hypothetical protein
VKIAAAAAIYFLAVFGTGFLLGTIRVLALEPRLGAVAATLCEAPFLLMAMAVAAYWTPRLVRIAAGFGAMLLVGLGALVLQQAADLAVGTAVRGISVHDQFARLATPEGAIYAALLVLFALMPAIVSTRGHDWA